jgi:hypothetical protein
MPTGVTPKVEPNVHMPSGVTPKVNQNKLNAMHDVAILLKIYQIKIHLKDVKLKI